MARNCIVPNCGKPVLAREWCSMHYSRWRRWGDVVEDSPPLYERPLLDRLANKFLVGDGCWEWLGTPSTPYGSIMIGGRSTPAHRVVYELLSGPIPPGLELDHLCRNTRCVRPAHLEPVTHQENARRGKQGVLREPLSACPHGHLLDEVNTYVSPQGWRRCRRCRCLRQRRYVQRKSVVGHVP